MSEAIQTPFKIAGRAHEIAGAREEGAIQEATANYNAKVSQSQGEAALKRSVQEAKMLQRRAKKIRGTNIAQGSPLYLMEENAVNARINELRVLEEGSIARTGAEQQAAFERRSGRIAKRATKRKVTASLIGAGGDIAGGAASVLSFTSGGF